MKRLTPIPLEGTGENPVCSPAARSRETAYGAHRLAMKAILSEAAIIQLAADGNPRLAMDHCAQIRSLSRRARVYRKLDSLAPGPSSVSFLLVDHSDPDAGLICPIKIQLGRNSDRLRGLGDAPFRMALERGVAAAWRVLGGSGAPPPVSPRFPLLEALFARRRPGGRLVPVVEGPSVELAATIAAAALFSGESTQKPVIATGSPQQPLEGAIDKAAVLAREGVSPDSHCILATGMGLDSNSPLAQAGTTVVQDCELSLRRAFAGLPWLKTRLVPRKQRQRLHIHVGSSRAQAPAPDFTLLPLPAELSARDLPAILRRVRAAITAPWADVSLAVPACLAAGLGHALKTHRSRIRFLDASGVAAAGQAEWWRNGEPRMALSESQAPEPAAGPGEPLKLVVNCVERSLPIPLGWTELKLSKLAGPDDLPAAVGRVLQTAREASSLDLAVAGPAVLSVALASQLRNDPRSVRYHQAARGAPGSGPTLAKPSDASARESLLYQVWFSNRDHLADEQEQLPRPGRVFVMSSPVIDPAVVPVDLLVNEIMPAEARKLLASGFESTVGHQGTAALLSSVLGIPVPLNRIAVQLAPGDTVVALKLAGRLPEGTVLQLDELGRLDYRLLRIDVRASLALDA